MKLLIRRDHCCASALSYLSLKESGGYIETTRRKGHEAIVRIRAECSMRDRHGGPRQRSGNLHAAIKLPCQCLDDARAEPGSDWVETSLRSANPIVGNGKPPACPVQFVGDDDQPSCSVRGERVLQGVDHKFRDGEPDTYCLRG